MIRLTVSVPGGNEASYALAGPQVSIGRGSRNALVVPHPTVSNRHASLEQRQAGWVLTDLGSTNGTCVDGQPLAPHSPMLLPSQARLQLGDVDVAFVEMADMADLPLDMTPPSDLSGTRLDVFEAQRSRKAGAWHRLSERIIEHVRARFAHEVMPAPLDLDDFISEVLLAVLRDISGFRDRGPGAFWGWLQRLAENRLHDLRRFYRRQRRSTAASVEPPDLDGLADPAALSATVYLRGRELEAVEREGVAGLPEAAREVYLLRRVEGREFADICTMLGRVSETAVRSQWKRAREHVREHLQRHADALAVRLPDWRD